MNLVSVWENHRLGCRCWGGEGGLELRLLQYLFSQSDVRSSQVLWVYISWVIRVLPPCARKLRPGRVDDFWTWVTLAQILWVGCASSRYIIFFTFCVSQLLVINHDNRVLSTIKKSDNRVHLLPNLVLENLLRNFWFPFCSVVPLPKTKL